MIVIHYGAGKHLLVVPASNYIPILKVALREYWMMVDDVVG